MLSSTVAKQGPATILHPPEVPQGVVVHDGCLRHLGGMECNRKCPKTLEDYMRRSAQFGYERTGSYCSIPFLRDASVGIWVVQNTPLRCLKVMKSP